MFTKGPTCGSDSKESACKVGDPGSIPGSEDPLEKEMTIHSSIMPREFHEQRSLVGYSPYWATKSQRQLSNYTFTFQRANCISISLQIKGQTGENIGRNTGENKGRHNSQYNGLKCFMQELFPSVINNILY